MIDLRGSSYLFEKPTYGELIAVNKTAAEMGRIIDNQSVTIIEELRKVGVLVDSVWDFVNTKQSYTPAIPILYKHVQNTHYHKRLLEGLMRSLICADSKGLGVDPIIELYKIGAKNNDYGFMSVAVWVIKAMIVRGEGPKVEPLLEIKSEIPEGAKKSIIKDLERAIKKGAPYKRKPKGK